MLKRKTPSDPTVADVLRRIDKLEESLAPLLCEAEANAGDFIPLSELPFPASTARKYIREGLLKAYRVGRKLFIRKTDLAAFMQQKPRKGRPKGARNKVSPIAVEAGNRLISGAV